ncbi:MAG TPA: hypothetical protein VLS25_09805 [Dehalococcoidia bacterium]|nr:hypothetical protein [Dehalococcoidia bacterium]
MTKEGTEAKQILFVGPKEAAEPVLAHLRAAGNRVSLVDDIEEARALLGSGGFDHAMLAASALDGILQRQSGLDLTEVEAWRRAVSAVAYDIENLLLALDVNLDEAGTDSRVTLADVRQRISGLSDFLRELMGELAMPSHGELRLKVMDLEGAIETAAMTAYPSAAERRQRLVIEVDEPVASVRADGVTLKRILSALLRFASSQTPRHGSVRVHAYQDGDEPVICITYPREAMTTTELQRLFSPAAGDDTPAGLGRVQPLAARHECRVWVESQRGAGVSLFLALPRWSAEQSHGVAAPAAQW